MACSQPFARKRGLSISTGEWELTEFEGEWLHFDGEVLIGSPTGGWITESGVESPEYSAVKGGLLVDNGSFTVSMVLQL